jgi:hypothetical protein
MQTPGAYEALPKIVSPRFTPLAFANFSPRLLQPLGSLGEKHLILKVLANGLATLANTFGVSFVLFVLAPGLKQRLG